MEHLHFGKSIFERIFTGIAAKKYIHVILFLCVVASLNAGTVHWITFFNTDDTNVGEYDKNARHFLYSNFINLVNTEVQQYGYDCKIYDFYGGSFSAENCKSCIANLQCDSTDVIFFYFVGHGGRTSNDFEHCKYPLLMFDNQVSRFIPMSWIHQSLKEKGAKLTMTLAVCSNIMFGYDGKTEIDEVMIPSVQSCKEVHTGETPHLSSLAKAFLGYSGDMIACSASPGQESWAVQTPFGGMDVFTYLHVSTLDIKKTEDGFSWPVFLKEVSEATTEATKEMPMQGAQTPIYDYDLIKIIR